MNKKPFKLDADIHKKVMELSIQLSSIEGRKVSMREVVERPLKDERVIKELIRGSELRRMGLKK